MIESESLWETVVSHRKFPRLLFFGGAVVVFASLVPLVTIEGMPIGLKLITSFVTELGFASIISAIVVVLVDRREREEFRKHMQSEQHKFFTRRFINLLTDLRLPESVAARLLP